jgi:hypothetical protein
LKPNCQPLLKVLADPHAMAGLDMADWDALLRQARGAILLSRLASLAESHGLMDGLPPEVQRHLNAARQIAERQSRALAWEARKLDQALARLDIPVVLLKGAAYALADLPPARGRLFGDIDILVDKARLGEVEAALRMHGWHGTHHSVYDQRYYRQWMHELPPLVHMRRQSLLDVHHNLLPETARLKTRPSLVIASARPMPGFRALHVPMLEDLVLHSATHLFHEGEWSHGLRDLTDLDDLLRHGCETRQDWWNGLTERARELNLSRPLAMALRYARMLLSTPIPDSVFEAAMTACSRMAWPWLDGLFIRGLLSFHAGCRLPGSDMANFVLFVRAHALRMPLHLLLPHLTYKAWLGMKLGEAKE